MSHTRLSDLLEQFFSCAGTFLLPVSSVEALKDRNENRGYRVALNYEM